LLAAKSAPKVADYTKYLGNGFGATSSAVSNYINANDGKIGG
jgi:predicted transcriptional regulator